MTDTYQVMIDDNFHYMVEGERDAQGGYPTLDAAIAACRRVVDRSLDHLYKPGTTAEMLYSHYTDFGDDPFIVVPLGKARSTFSAWDYAKQRAAEMCAVAAAPPKPPHEPEIGSPPLAP